LANRNSDIRQEWHADFGRHSDESQNQDRFCPAVFLFFKTAGFIRMTFMVKGSKEKVATPGVDLGSNPGTKATPGVDL